MMVKAIESIFIRSNAWISIDDFADANLRGFVARFRSDNSDFSGFTNFPVYMRDMLVKNVFNKSGAPGQEGELSEFKFLENHR